MIIVLHNTVKVSEKEHIVEYLKSKGLTVREIVGEKETVLGAVGSIAMDSRQIELLPGVAQVIPITQPYKLASRELKKDDTVFNVGPVKIGGPRVCVIAGPCAVESREQIITSAIAVKKAGAVMLRGGAFKPRTSPYAFQGLGEEGCKYLKEAGELTGLPVVTEIVSPSDAEMMRDYIDVFQIGARNMQNFELLKKVGSMDMPVILKRGLSATIQEWLMAAEYLLSAGTDKVILCERGIRTFETMTRNTLDLSAIPVVQKLSHLPVIVDPSHGTGLRNKVLPMALAGVAAGANGLIIEVHPDPDNATSDGPQSLYPEQFEKLMCDIEALSPVVGKEITRIPDLRHQAMAASVHDSKISLKDSKPRAVFQGTKGAYSELAANTFFQGTDVEAVPVSKFKDIFKEVLSGKSDWGIVPLENSVAGSILENYDLLYLYPDLRIIGEIKVRIRHNLLARKGASAEEIKKVYSHPQALSQCTEYLEKNGIEAVSFFDTAGAASYVSQQDDLTIAAIAGVDAADYYGLDILAEGLESNPHNYTRFAIIAREDMARSIDDCDKVSVVFSTPDKAGALSGCLSVFSEYGLNMTKLESRPIHGKPWSYMFYVDLELPEDRSIFDKAVDKISNMAEDFRIMGLYQSK
ncbi:MAG: 3-deoxy-7-phosphoheptulonate synthase [Spirochaetaceae bacterium 4572_59]|nr:MAG: 3-deoxy-7-phosphoheptulonate synthase [Spirochaetaceae bacterium 4572_59]